MLLGEVYAPNCVVKAMGLNAYLVSPGRSCFVEIETVDHLGNLITVGGQSNAFTLAVKNRLHPSPWQPIDIQVHDLENGTYEVFYSMNNIGIFDMHFQYKNTTIPSQMCVSVLTSGFLSAL